MEKILIDKSDFILLSCFNIVSLTRGNNFSNFDLRKGLFQRFRQIKRFESNKNTQNIGITYNSQLVYVYDLFGNLNIYPRA